MWIRILLGLAVLLLVLRMLQRPSSRPASRFKCASCKNCGKLFEDGVLCRFGRSETFKNETHIANCQDHERA